MQMDLGLSEKVVIVTGAGGQLGREMALGFARERSFVVVNDIDGSAAESTASEVLQYTEKSLGLQGDVSSYDNVKALVDEVIRTFGQVDVLVNNAAIFNPKLFMDTDHKEWLPLLQVDLVGYLNTMHAVLPHMTERRYGKIVCISSAAAKLGAANNAIYSAAKGGINSFVKATAREVGRRGININAVCPAIITRPESAFQKENMDKIVRAYPLGRLADPGDIVDPVLFLASDRAGYITGQAISVDGGFSMQ